MSSKEELLQRAKEMKEELEKLHKQLKEKEEELKKINEKNAVIEKEKNDLKFQMEEMCEDAKTRFEQNTAHILSLESTLKQVTGEISLHEDEKNKLRKELKERDILLSDITIKCSEREKDLLAEQTKSAIAQKKITMLEETAVHAKTLGTVGKSTDTSQPYVAATSTTTNTSAGINNVDTATSGTNNTTTSTRQNVQSTQSASSLLAGIIAPAPGSTNVTGTPAAIASLSYGIKLPIYKHPGDIETFINRFEQFCITQNIDANRKANLLMTSLDDAAFTVVKRELSDEERKDYEFTKQHLLKRFDILKDAGQKRLLFRQAKQEGGQTIEEFYTNLLGMAAKAFPGESGTSVDRMLLDQIICGCNDEKTRLYLLEKGPTTSRDALSLAVSYQAAIKYNENLKESIAVVAAMQTSHDKERIESKRNDGYKEASWRDHKSDYRYDRYQPWRENMNIHQKGEKITTKEIVTTTIMAETITGTKMKILICQTDTDMTDTTTVSITGQTIQYMVLVMQLIAQHTLSTQ